MRQNVSRDLGGVKDAQRGQLRVEVRYRGRGV